MNSTLANNTRSFATLAQLSEGEENAHIRVRLVNGREVFGQLLNIGPDGLLLLDEEDRHIDVTMADIRAIDLRRSRRALEWTVALGAIPLVTGILVLVSMIPGFNAKRGDVMIVFMILAAIFSWLTSIQRVRERVASVFVRWDPVYATGASNPFDTQPLGER